MNDNSKLPSIAIHGKRMDFDSPKVMGIVNATPDSFYSRVLSSDFESLTQRVGKMIEAGADILDIGGVSTRPFSEPVSASEEMDRIIPIIEWTYKHFPDVWISVDTYRAQVVKAVQDIGVDIINDISAGKMDEGMLDAVAASGLPYIAMHIQGTPDTMQVAPEYAIVSVEVLDFGIQFLAQLRSKGIYQIIFDPGFGFGKTIEHNYTLLKDLSNFTILNVPLLVGISRKGMLWKVIDKTPQEALPATITAHTIALMNGANILRVHDVSAAVDSVKIYNQYMNVIDSKH